MVDHPEPFFRRREVASADARERTPEERLLAVCDLHDAALQLIAERVVRENPGATAHDVLAAQREWLEFSPEEPGFRRVTWPR